MSPNDLILPHGSSLPPVLIFYFYHRMHLWVQIAALLSVFSSVPFPAWSTTVSQTEPPCLPFASPRCPFHVNENAVFLLLYQMTRKCVTLTLEDNPPTHTPQHISTKCPFNAGRKYDRRECEEGVDKVGRSHCVSGAEQSRVFWHRSLQSHQLKA